MKYSLRLKLILAIGIPLILVYMTVLAVDYVMSRHDAIAKMEAYMVEVASSQAKEIDGRLKTVAQISKSSADFLTCFPQQEPDKLDQILTHTILQSDDVYGSTISFESYMRDGQPVDFSPYAFRNSPNTVSNSHQDPTPHEPPKPANTLKAESAAGAASTTPPGTPFATDAHSEELTKNQVHSSKLTYLDIAKAYRYKEFDWYLLPKLQNHPAWTDPYYDSGAGNALMCTYGSPFYENDQFAGVVTVDLSLDGLKEQLAKQAPEGGYLFLISSTGTCISHPNDAYIMSESVFSLASWRKSEELRELGQKMIHGQQGVVRMDCGTRGICWYAYVPVQSVGWSLAVVMDERTVLAGVYHRLNQQFFVLLAGLAIIFVIIVAISAWTTSPIHRLAIAADKVANGDLNAQVENIHSRDEIGQFAQTFNRMVTDLRETVNQRIAESVARKSVERELHVARQIQLSLLPMLRPPFPDRMEFELYADNMAAKFIAGDFFDFWLLDEDRLAIVMADVSGKGVPAAMFMAVTRTLLRTLATAEETPGETLNKVNDALASEDHEGMFVTLFFAHYYVKTGRIVYANAAHNRPYIIRQGTQATLEGDSTGTMCGLFSGMEYEVLETHLDPGDQFVLYTDGVTEANHPTTITDENGEEKEICCMFGDERLGSLLSRIGKLSVGQIADAVIRTADEFRNHEAQDDVTVLVLRRKL